MDVAQHIDLTLIDGYLEALDLSVITQMLDLYITQSESYLLEVATAIKFSDDKAWQEQCHKMKGSAASAGLTKVYEKLVAIEKSTESSTIKSTYLHELTSLNADAITAFKAWLAIQ